MKKTFIKTLLATIFILFALSCSEDKEDNIDPSTTSIVNSDTIATSNSDENNTTESTTTITEDNNDNSEPENPATEENNGTEAPSTSDDQTAVGWGETYKPLCKQKNTGLPAEEKGKRDASCDCQAEKIDAAGITTLQEFDEKSSNDVAFQSEMEKCTKEEEKTPEEEKPSEDKEETPAVWVNNDFISNWYKTCKITASKPGTCDCQALLMMDYNVKSQGDYINLFSSDQAFITKFTACAQ